MYFLQVHCNLTSENGLLKLTLVDPFENNENTEVQVNIYHTVY